MSRVEYKERVRQGKIFQLKLKHGISGVEARKLVDEEQLRVDARAQSRPVNFRKVRALNRKHKKQIKRRRRSSNPFQYASPSRSRRFPAGGRLIYAGSPGSGRRS